MDKMKIYNKLPILVQNIACNYEGLRIKKTRYGDAFWKFLKEYEARNTWTYKEICDYRDERLRSLIEHSYKTVPYYRNLFDDLGLDYKEIRTLSDLKVLPILDKQTINDNFDKFVSTNYDKNNLIMSHTSGTTGSGFKFYTTPEAISEQWAVWWKYRKNLGIDFDMWSANFGSKLIVPISQKKPPYWRINFPGKQVYFSAFHQSEENLYYYFKEIKKRRIEWIHGFPSLITLLASFMLNNSLSLGYKLKFITIGAENLLEYQRSIIEEAFGCKVFQHYGLAEGVANFSQNRSGKIIVDEDFSATEFIFMDGNYRIIGTNLSNYAMPLIRYDTKDTATLSKIHNSSGRIIESIDGRSEDYITLPNGIKVGKLDHAFKDTINFREVQLYQKKDYSINILVVKKNINHKKDEELAYKMLRDSLGDDINIEFRYVNKIERTKGGKIKFVVSEIE